MANRLFQQFRFSLEKKVVELWGHVTFGAVGAPTLDTANSKGIKSIVRNSAGTYTITLQDTYKYLLKVDAHWINPGAAPAAPSVYVVSQNIGNLAAPTIVIKTNAAGTATDPATTDELKFHLTFRDSGAV